MLYIAFVCIFLSIFLFTYNKNHLSKKNTFNLYFIIHIYFFYPYRPLSEIKDYYYYYYLQLVSLYPPTQNNGKIYNN